LGGVPQINEELGEVTQTVSVFQKPDKPEALSIEANFPAIDTTLDLLAVNPLNLPQAPTLTAVAPEERDIAAPAPFNKTAPSAPTLGTHHYPDEPTEVIPLAPTIRELLLPDAPSTVDVAFTGILPSALSAAPSTQFTFSEQDYASALLSKINSRLLELISGFSTGLDPQVEQQIWDRLRRRTSAATRRLKTQVTRAWSAAGWDMPGGDLQNKIYEAEQESVNQDISDSREIAIAQADLEQKNFQFALTTANQIEGILIQHADTVQQRAFEAAKYSVQAAIELYGLKVTEYNANIEAYKAQAQVYRDRIQGELAKIEVYKAQLEGQKLIGDLNQQDVSIYREQINAVLAVYELYKSRLESVKTRMQGDELLLKQFEYQINAFSAEIQAKALEYNNYKIANDAELTRTERYKARLAAFGEEVNAFKTLVDARKTQQDSEIEVNQRIPLEAFKQKSESLRTLVQAESERLKALTDITKSRAEIYDTETRAEAARVDTEVKAQDNEIKKLVAQSNIRIESLKSNISSFLAKIELLNDASKAAAQVAAQITAAAMSSVNLSASISQSTSSSTSESESISHSTSSSVSESTTHTD
jgi:hypothetical protein